MAARRQRRKDQPLAERVAELEELVERLTIPGGSPRDALWALWEGPPFLAAGDIAWVYDPDGQASGPTVGPVIGSKINHDRVKVLPP